MLTKPITFLDVSDALRGHLEIGDAINEAALLVTLLASDAFASVQSAQDIPTSYAEAEKTLGQGWGLFKESKLYHACPGVAIDQAIRQVRSLLAQKSPQALAKHLMEKAIDRGLRSKTDEFPLPLPVMELAVGLMGAEKHSVNLQHTLSLSGLYSLEAPENATVDVLKATPLALVVTQLLGATLQQKTERDLFQPAESDLFQPGGVIHDGVLAAPPMALKLDTQAFDYRYAQEACLNRMLSEVSKKGVLLTPAGLLTQRSSYALRETLIEDNILEAVIQLPRGVLKFTGIAPVLLLMDRTRQPGDPVQFHTLESLDAPHNQAVLQRVRERKPDKTGVVVSQNDVRDEDYNLTVNRYNLGPATKTMAQLEGTINLEGLAKIIKTQNLPTMAIDAEAQDIFFEIAPKDISENGCIKTPEKQIVMDARHQRRANNQRVQAGDILLVIKGSVTKVGYVPDDCPDNWVAGQSFLMIRPLPKIGTEYLFQYLNSELVQSYLKERTFGEVMTIIKAADVASIPVPLPEPRDLKAVRDTHEHIQAEYAAIEEHRQVIEQLKNKLWALPN